MDSMEIESLLFKQIDRPKHHLMTKVINLWSNRYRINVYVETEEEGLIKRKISSSHFCHFDSGKLKIIDLEPTQEEKAKRIRY